MLNQESDTLKEVGIVEGGKSVDEQSVEDNTDLNEKDVLEDHHDETSEDENEEIERLKAKNKWLKREKLCLSKQHLSDMQKLREENKWKLSIMKHEKVFFVVSMYFIIILAF